MTRRIHLVQKDANQVVDPFGSSATAPEEADAVRSAAASRNGGPNPLSVETLEVMLW